MKLGYCGTISINLVQMDSLNLKVYRSEQFLEMAKPTFEIIISRIIAILDLLIAMTLIGVASFQFAKGATLLTGPNSDGEKVTRLVCYASIIYIFLLIQIVMSIQLYVASGEISDGPIYAIKVFTWWREWSVSYVMAMLLHAMVVVMLMEQGQRRVISLVSTLAHAALRPIGIVVIGRFKHRLENQLPRT